MIKFHLISLFIGISFLGIAFSQVLNLNVSLDSHVHVYFDDDSKLLKDLEEYNKLITYKAFLISPSYTVTASDYDEWDLNGELKNPATRKIWNDRTANIVKKYPQRFHGLCGIGWEWDDLSDVLTDCLKNPEMVGFKLRFWEPNRKGLEGFSNTKNFEKINQALLKNARTKILLIHTSVNDISTIGGYAPQGWTTQIIYQLYLKEIEAIVSLAELHPGIKVIIAHSLGTGRMVQYLQTVLKSKPHVQNIVLDASGTMQDDMLDYHESLLEAWKEFGFDKIVFGSDLSLGEPNTDWKNDLIKEYARFKMINDPINRDKFFYKTGRSILDFLNQ